MRRTSRAILVHLGSAVPVILSILLFLGSCSQPSSPFVLRASVTTEPIVGAVLDYHASLHIVGVDMPNTSILVEMPEAVEVVGGTPQWTGDLSVGETVDLDMKLRVNQPGQWLILTQVLARPYTGSITTFGSSYQILLISAWDHGRIVDDAALQQTRMPCGPEPSCGTPPQPPSRPPVTVTPSS
jgi:hypothetical protein